MKKIHISTALFGGNQKINTIIPAQINCDYDVTISCYSDQNTFSRENALHTRTKGKIPKMLEWINVDADYYIWMDASFNIKTNTFISDMIKCIGDYDICVYKHSERSSIYDELLCVEHLVNNLKMPHYISRYGGEPMRDQVNSYLLDHNFTDNKLFEMGFFIYKKTLVSNRDYNLMTDWFFHNCFWSIQDQLSFPYLLNKHNVKYTTFNEGNIYHNPYVIFNHRW